MQPNTECLVFGWYLSYRIVRGNRLTEKESANSPPKHLSFQIKPQKVFLKSRADFQTF